jgi:hypothetical protein
MRRLSRIGCGGVSVDLDLPGIVTTWMEVQRHRRAIELSFDFVFDLCGRDEHATEVARDSASFTAPEAN